MDNLLTQAEVARELDVSRATACRMFEAGRLPLVTLPGIGKRVWAPAFYELKALNYRTKKLTEKDWTQEWLDSLSPPNPSSESSVESGATIAGEPLVLSTAEKITT